MVLSLMEKNETEQGRQGGPEVGVEVTWEKDRLLFIQSGKNL